MSDMELSEQVETIKALMKVSNLLAGGSAFIISGQWFADWKASVGFHGTALGTAIRPIDNGVLLNAGEMKKGLAEGMDYDIVTREIWEQLSSWFGGGPVIERPVEKNPKTGQCVTVVWQNAIEVNYRKEKNHFSYSLFGTVKGLKALACQRFHCDLDTARLWDYFDRVKQCVLEDERMLCDYHIDDNCPLLLDTKDETGNWVTALESIRKLEYMEVKPGVCGLRNMGNTCYMNSALQCLLHLRGFVSFFHDKWESQINNTNPLGTKGCVASAFAQLLKAVWNDNRDSTVVAPRMFKATLGDFAEQFNNTQQHDSHEFLSRLLDLVHEDLNRVHDKPIVPEVVGDGVDDMETAKQYWDGYKSRNDSIVVDMFHGLYKSRLICPNCKRTTVVFDPYSSLTVPLPLPTVTSPPFTFVPFDVMQPRVLMSVTLVTDLTMLADAVDALSEKIHRQVNAVFAERYLNSTDLQWRTILSTNLPENQLIAFEIPQHKLASVFAPVRLAIPNGVQGSIRVVELASFYLVEISGEYASIEEVQAACEAKFACLFVPSQAVITDKYMKRVQSKMCEPRIPFDEGQRMRCRIIPRSKSSGEKFVRDDNVLRVSNTQVEVLLNPDYLSEDQFCWSALKNVENTLQKAPKTKRITGTSLTACIDDFSRDEVLDEDNMAFCRHCRDFFRANKKMDIWSVPEVLIVHMKRFYSKGHYQRKLTLRVDYPDYLDLAPHVIGPQSVSGVKYRLVGVVEHEGGLAGGHYVSNSWHDDLSNWYHFNDERTKPVKNNTHHSESAYILFYAKT